MFDPSVPTGDQIRIAEALGDEYGLGAGDVITIVRKFDEALTKRWLEINAKYSQPCTVPGCTKPSVPLSQHCGDHIFTA